jgi:membrane associated rhomboid family serine protease
MKTNPGHSILGINSLAVKFIIKAIFVIILVYIFGKVFFFFKTWIFLFAPAAIFTFLWGRSMLKNEPIINVLKDYITFIPIIHSDDQWKGERRIRVTYFLILINVFIHYAILLFVPESRTSIIEAFMFLPQTSDPLHGIISPVTSMFLHGSDGHLWGNMLFLWVFGLVVERRIGLKRLLALYFLTGVFANIASAVIYPMFLKTTFHGIGASGAISGIMGVFMIRLFFKKIVFPIPILGIFFLIFPINFRIRINSLIVIGLFFLSDLSSGIKQFEGSMSRIGHWVHVFGMLLGIGAALLFRFHKQATEEMYTEIGVEEIEKEVSFKDGQGALKTALQYNPENVTALLALARDKSTLNPTQEGREYYHKVISIVMRTDANRAADIFMEYFEVYSDMIEPELQYRIAAILFRRKEYEVAVRMLEQMVDHTLVSEAVQEKSLFQLAYLTDQLGLADQARFRYQQFLERFPNSSHANVVKQHLGRYES